MIGGTAFDRLTAALHAHGAKVIAKSGSARAQCPAHEDRTPSLSVRQIEGQALVHCFAGCETADVVAALGLTMADLFDERRGATYRYDDGRVVTRTPEKRFVQSGHSPGVVQLYRLAKVVDAVKNGVTVHLVEGEKDVHALESIGAVATTAPMGADSFGNVDASPLEGANVVVVPDQDVPGERWLRAVLATVGPIAATVEVRRVAVGKDAADHVAAGHGLEDLVPVESPVSGHRALVLTAASTIPVRPVHWLWRDRLPDASLALIGGREGVGKTTIAYQFAADLTRGRLAGAHFGRPQAVIVAATEDSWAHTIVPRLMAAEADLALVFRVDVVVAEGLGDALSLPRDLAALGRCIDEVGAVLVLLDPLMSRLDVRLDAHRDSEVRQALEPLVRLADRHRASVLGVIHVNKSTGSDALTRIMGSRAFAAVARAVLFVLTDPDDEDVRLLGHAKNNLGRLEPTLTFRIVSATVARTDEGLVTTGQILWTGETDRSINEAIESADEGGETRTAVGEAADWMTDWLTSRGGSDDSVNIKKAGAAAGHSASAIQRARRKLKMPTTSQGFPRRTYWSLLGTQPGEESGSPVVSRPGESGTTETTDTTGLTATQSCQSFQSVHTPREGDTTALDEAS